MIGKNQEWNCIVYSSWAVLLSFTTCPLNYFFVSQAGWRVSRITKENK